MCSAHTTLAAANSQMLADSMWHISFAQFYRSIFNVDVHIQIKCILVVYEREKVLAR